MAIIKCPECGHQTSDKAPICPNCGVEIAGKIVKCPSCGEVYFKSESACPHCHKAAPGDNEPDIEHQEGDKPASQNKDLQAQTTLGQVVNSNEQQELQASDVDNNVPNNKKNNKTTLIVSIIIAVLVIGTCLYFYTNASNDKEQDEYIFALRSDDPTILQAYLDNFKDAPLEHWDSINSRLQLLLKLDQDWTNAVVSGSKIALTDYIKTHPDSPHRQEALEKIDSIDWAQCSNLNTADAYQMYIDEHSDGNHYEEAMIALKKIKSGEVSNDDKQVISGIFHNFFLSLNLKDESGLTDNIYEPITFLGKTNATKSDVVTFMHKLYRDDVENMTWSLPGGYDIQKREIGDEQYEYNVTFMAEQDVKKTDGTEHKNKFRFNAKINPDGKITEMAMTKINE